MKKFSIRMLIACFMLISSTSFAQKTEYFGDTLEKSLSDKDATATKKENLWKNGSVMYSDKASDWIRQAIKSYEEGIPLEILLPDIFPPDGSGGTAIEEEKEVVDTPEEEPVEEVVSKKLPSEAPSFYLNSILYFASGDWTIWINDEKISRGDLYSKLDIVKVTEKEVALVWRNTQIEHIYPQWKEVFSPLENGRYVSNRKNVVIDVETGDVSFILGLNQSLITARMKIIEGPADSMPIASSDSSNSRRRQGEDEEVPKAVMPNKVKKEGLAEDLNLGDEIGGENMNNYLQKLDMLQSILGSSTPKQ